MNIFCATKLLLSVMGLLATNCSTSSAPSTAPKSTESASTMSSTRWQQSYIRLHSLVTTSAGVVATADTETGPRIDSLAVDTGRTQWTRTGAARLLATETSLYAIDKTAIIRLAIANGDEIARYALEPAPRPALATMRAHEVLVVHNGTLRSLDGAGLQLQWSINLNTHVLNAIQVAANSSHILVVGSRHLLAVGSGGKVMWKIVLPPNQRALGRFPVVMHSSRSWIGLRSATSELSSGRQTGLASIDLTSGRLGPTDTITGLLMALPARNHQDVQVLDVLDGLVGFSGQTSQVIWRTPGAPTAMTRLDPHGSLWFATTSGQVKRVSVSDGTCHAELSLESKGRPVPPAPDLKPGIVRQAIGEIRAIALHSPCLLVAVQFAESAELTCHDSTNVPPARPCP